MTEESKETGILLRMRMMQCGQLIAVIVQYIKIVNAKVPGYKGFMKWLVASLIVSYETMRVKWLLGFTDRISYIIKFSWRNIIGNTCSELYQINDESYNQIILKVTSKIILCDFNFFAMVIYIFPDTLWITHFHHFTGTPIFNIVIFATIPQSSSYESYGRVWSQRT